MGRVKLEIRKIENPTNRQVTYSKRRNGLIKKAYELSVLCEIDIALLMFSPSGRLNHFSGKKRIEDVIARFASLSDHERTKSQCLKWCDSQSGANAPRKIENPEMLIKAARKLKQESYMTIGSQFPSSRSTSLEAVQYEIQRTQVQLQEMEGRLRIYEGDVKSISSIQQLENLEQHLQNALETLRMHKYAMENSTHAAAVMAFSTPAGPGRSTSASQMAQLYGLQLQQQQQAATPSSMLPTAGGVLLHHWLQSAATERTNVGADDNNVNHHCTTATTPNAHCSVDHPSATILSLRESPGECSSAGSSLYSRAQQLCQVSGGEHHHHHHHLQAAADVEHHHHHHHLQAAADVEHHHEHGSVPGGAAAATLEILSTTTTPPQMGLACSRQLYHHNSHDCSSSMAADLESSPCDAAAPIHMQQHEPSADDGAAAARFSCSYRDYIDMNRYHHQDMDSTASAFASAASLGFSVPAATDHHLRHHHQQQWQSAMQQSTSVAAAAGILPTLPSLSTQAQAVMGMMLQASRRQMKDEIQQQQQQEVSRSSSDTDNNNNHSTTVMMSVPTSFMDMIHENDDTGNEQQQQEQLRMEEEEELEEEEEEETCRPMAMAMCDTQNTTAAVGMSEMSGEHNNYHDHYNAAAGAEHSYNLQRQQRRQMHVQATCTAAAGGAEAESKLQEEE